MSKNNFLGGFIGTTGNWIVRDQGLATFNGEFNIGDTAKMISVNSWPNYSNDEGFGIVKTSGSGSISVHAGNYVFVAGCGGGGGGAHDNDCRTVYRPGGSGGAGKALVDLSAVGSIVINYSVGSGGPGTPGNDASGHPGSATNITIGNFTLSCGGGGGGTASPGSTGNVTANGPQLAFSTNNVFVSTVVTEKDPDNNFTYTSIPTGAGGGGGRCGENATSGAGANGFLYIRYGDGINVGTTLTNDQDPSSSGQNSCYTPNY